MGYAFPVAFDAPIELLGLNLVGGNGFIWIDLFWRSTARHQETYELSVHLLDPETGQSFVSASGTIQKQSWKKGELFGERMILWLDAVPPGQYSLGLALGDRRSIDRRTGELLPETVAVLNVPVLVQPPASKDSPVLDKGGIIAHPPFTPAEP
jgi:hypothetical protein